MAEIKFKIGDKVRVKTHKEFYDLQIPKRLYDPSMGVETCGNVYEVKQIDPVDNTILLSSGLWYTPDTVEPAEEILKDTARKITDSVPDLREMIKEASIQQVRELKASLSFIAEAKLKLDLSDEYVLLESEDGEEYTLGGLIADLKKRYNEI